jgi:hypothetical protein
MNGYVPLYVPEAQYREMLDHLVALITKLDAASPPAATEAPPAQTNDGWSDDVWRNVWLDVTDNTRKVLLTLATRPDERLSLRKIAQFTEIETTEVQAALSSFTKRMRQSGPTEWPFTYRKDSQTGRYRYWMSEETAKIVLALADAGDPVESV